MSHASCFFTSSLSGIYIYIYERELSSLSSFSVVLIFQGGRLILPVNGVLSSDVGGGLMWVELWGFESPLICLVSFGRLNGCVPSIQFS